MDILLGLLGMAALLLWGMRLVRTGVQRAFGQQLRHVIAISTRNRFTAALSGVGVTALLQSSTATALMMASFSEQGLLATSSALAVMLGADLGVALMAPVLSLDLGLFASILLLAGYVSFMVGRGRARNLGRLAIGFGLIFLAIGLLGETAAPIRSSEVIRDIFAAMESEPLLAVLLTGFLTWLVHSSLATVLFVVGLASSGVVTHESALAMVLGVNLGAAAPAVVASLTLPPAARRAPLGNAIFRVAGVLIALLFLPKLVALASGIGVSVTAQILAFHVVFNLALVGVFIWFLGPVARLSERLIPDREVADDDIGPRYLDRAALSSPAVALTLAARETLRMGDLVEEMLRGALDALKTDSAARVGVVEAMDDRVDALHEAIKTYCMEISREELSTDDGHRCGEVLTFATNLEHVGDIVDNSMLEIANKKIRVNIPFSDVGWEEIVSTFERVLDHLKLALSVFMSDDVLLARKLLHEKDQFRYEVLHLSENHYERLRSGQRETIATSSMHLDVLRDLRHINSHLTSAAFPILERAGELRDTRLRASGQ